MKHRSLCFEPNNSGVPCQSIKWSLMLLIPYKSWANAILVGQSTAEFSSLIMIWSYLYIAWSASVKWVRSLLLCTGVKWMFWTLSGLNSPFFLPHSWTCCELNKRTKPSDWWCQSNNSSHLYSSHWKTCCRDWLGRRSWWDGIQLHFVSKWNCDSHKSVYYHPYKICKRKTNNLYCEAPGFGKGDKILSRVGHTV